MQCEPILASSLGGVDISLQRSLKQRNIRIEPALWISTLGVIPVVVCHMILMTEVDNAYH
jgi:peptidoglycan/LPS O-acetylase OafA/YrhL